MPNIDWSNFTPLTALLGGLLIGAAASALLLLNGRILGISGIVGGLLQPHKDDNAWRLWFVAGLLVPPLLLGLSRTMEAPRFSGGLLGVALAGLLVGFGSRMGSGCTSGHGICAWRGCRGVRSSQRSASC